jgi:plasmid stabilization system protein ParE
LERIVKPIFFTTRALNDLEKIARFNTSLLGFEKSKSVTYDIIKCLEILENPEYDFSKIGSVDSEFAHLKRNYRKLIHSYYKITDREGNDKIYVNRIFNTRQNPKKNK